MSCQNIDEHTFEELFEAYFEPICRFLNLYTKDVAIIEDVVQDVFCNLWTNRDFLQIKHIKSYLYTSSRNKVLNHIRDEKLHASILATYMLEEKGLRAAYDCVNEEEFIKRLDAIINDLPDKCKNVFKLSRFKKMSYREIAKQEGISEKMVEKHISTALKKIKSQLTRVTFILL